MGKQRIVLPALILSLLSVVLVGCGRKEVTTSAPPKGREAALAQLSDKARQAFFKAALGPLGNVPVPPDNPITPEKVELGKMLFFDPRLSGDRKTSCASCHIPEKAWADGRVVCVGVGGRKGMRNTPSLLNVAYYQKFFWDGRARSLEDQALKELSSPHMGSSPERAARAIAAIPGYGPLFRAAFGSDQVTPDRLAKALATFERTIVTGPSPFDKFIEGDTEALTEEQKKGLEIFLTRGKCTDCHRTRFFTNHEIARTTLYMAPDYGLYNLTKKEYDVGKFRVPTLRNIALTAPYLHNGYEATLEDVAFFTLNGRSRRYMKEHGEIMPIKPFTDDELKSVVEFLKSLTGELPAIERPRQLPQ
ncbi:MAG TPA: cytochrome c peroxidase [Blastocatellia bacterium]|nr:cytochrome c peroxidase [Blastocatellia bacterium]